MTSDTARSASTLRKAKRSLDTTSSNNSGRSWNSGGSNKKKNGNPRTLGVAWGANSLSSTRSSSRNSPFSDFGSYMVEKNRKLHQQFADAASSNSQQPIFQGISIFVDGFTIPSCQELRGYMLNYGGRFENYFSRRCVTHIICSNLPDSKLKNIRSFSRGLPVVKPKWILDSIAANKLLNWVPYQLDQLTDSQPKLSAFFGPKSYRVSDGSLKNTCFEINDQANDHSSVNTPLLLDASSSEVKESTDRGKKIVEDEFDRPDEYSRAVMGGKASSTHEIDLTTQKAIDLETDKECVMSNALIGSLRQQNEINKDSSTATASEASRSHLIVEDPKFVENYFKNSRLHFIGTWRNRYRKRFPLLSSGSSTTGSEQRLSVNSHKQVILHVDMDCFFVSVVVRNLPELQDKPVAVCHSDNWKGTAEISSANYPARSYGIQAGMFIRDAKALCPKLVILPYNFSAYEEVADQFYEILHKRCSKVQAVSCDEAFLDVTNLECENPEVLALSIRNEILEITGCSASVGIAGNMLMARLATRAAKPAGQCYIPEDKVDDYMRELPISALPGIGHVLERKLRKQNITTCGELHMISKDFLQREFGMKTGEMLWNHSRGLDDRHVGLIQESKTICAEVNWGVRLRDQKDAQSFLQSLCKEVSLRLQGCEVAGRTFTLKMKKRRRDAEEPAKYMGCGNCENLSRSLTVPVATDDVEVLQRISKQLLGSFYIDVKEIRGLGLQVSKLEATHACKKGLEKSYMKSWLTNASRHANKTNSECWENDDGTSDQLDSDLVESSCQIDNNAHVNSESENPHSELPALSNLDMGVVESLPTELFAELNEIYGGKLVEAIKRKSCKSFTTRSYSHISRGKDIIFEDGGFPQTKSSSLSSSFSKERNQEFQPAQILNDGGAIPSGVELANLMPTSLSQVDQRVLQQLPEDLRVDILDSLPTHGKSGLLSGVSPGAAISPGIKMNENKSECIVPVSVNSLWVGNPPLWVENFKASNFYISKKFADMYYKSLPSEKLSSLLGNFIVEYLGPQDPSSVGWYQAIDDFCEVIKDYVKLKIEADIEEIYFCFRLLKRLSKKSSFFLEVYDMIYPFLQASVGENYGGSLDLS